MRRGLLGLILVLAALLASACGNDAGDPVFRLERLDIVSSVDPASFVPGVFVTVTVTAENPTAERIEFGMGSSTCQYRAFVRFGGEDRAMAVDRVCTTDMAVWSLAPGESQSESWTWTGEVYVDGVPQRLPAGSYELVGVAGPFAGAPFVVTITD